MQPLHKRLLAVLGAASAAAALLTSTPTFAEESGPPGWALREEVDLSDSSRWILETGQAENTSSYDRPENVAFGADSLTITGKRESWAGRTLTSGDAKGVGIVIPNYARVEAVGSASYGAGLWPALMWLRPRDSAHGEIDLMEVFSTADRVTSTIHSEYGPSHRQRQGSALWSMLPSTDPEADHTYVMEKTPERIVLSVDGVVMLDATPETVPSGFDWNAIFERPGATWYPRVTMQIGCPPADPDCGLGLPHASWREGTVQLKSLRVWEWTGEETSPPTDPAPQPPAVPAPSPTAPPPPEPTTPPAPEPTTSPAPDPTSPPSEPGPGQSPVVDPETQGAFALQRGRELRHVALGAGEGTSAASVDLRVPADTGSGALYGSLQVHSSPNGRSGHRATVAIRPDGSLRLTAQTLVDGRRTLLDERVAAPRGAVLPGESVRLEIAVANGIVHARVWPADEAAPDWQIVETTIASDREGTVQLFGYVSRSAPRDVTLKWSGLNAGG